MKQLSKKYLMINGIEGLGQIKKDANCMISSVQGLRYPTYKAADSHLCTITLPKTKLKIIQNLIIFFQVGNKLVVSNPLKDFGST